MYNTLCSAYHIMHNAHALDSCCLDALKHIHHMFGLESFQLRVQHHKCSTTTTAITAPMNTRYIRPFHSSEQAYIKHSLAHDNDGLVPSGYLVLEHSIY